MMPNVGELVRQLELLAPRAYAASWDNVGLLLGDPADPVERILTCLTVTPAVVAEAVAKQVSLIVTHHPILFRGTKTLSRNSPEGKLLHPLLRAGIAVYSPHTAWDNAPGGINDGLAQIFALTDVEPLRPLLGAKLCKLTVFVPDADLMAVSDAMFRAGAGRIGANDRYTECSFRTPGTGTFRPGDQANPTIGSIGQREEVAEQRLEVIVSESQLATVVRAMRQAHSYEEPAFDVYPLQPLSIGGEGRVGNLSQPVTLQELAKVAKDRLPASAVGMVGDPQRSIRRVAVACGAAGEFLSDAARAQADLFLTGELRFHDAWLAETLGVAVLIPGHHATERLGVEQLASQLQLRFPTVPVAASEAETDPIRYVGIGSTSRTDDGA
jgi:dinuclear metal center YbgI/SA1388 family protein